MHLQLSYIILYVADQHASKSFYSILLKMKPCLDVPGMTAFDISENIKLGIMPNTGIEKIFADKMPSPELANGIPRCELYLHCSDPIEREMDRAIACGAKLISPISDRDWGDRVCYLSDPDGHIIALACSI